jgi:hypothetical protein
MNSNIAVVSSRFRELFPDHRLLAIQLNGFSHSLFYDNGTATAAPEVLRYSSYAPEQKWDKRAMVIFNNIPHHYYQGQPLEHVFIMPEDR